MKEIMLALFGAIGSLIASAFGGFDAGMVALIVFMSVDYVSGLVVAGIFKKSKKSASGALESGAGFKGLLKKGMCLLIVLVACQLDALMGSSFVRDAVILAFIANELISLIENAGLMGIEIPPIVSKSIDILNRKEGAKWN